MTETIIFKNKKYPARSIELNFDGITENQYISVISLEKELMNEEFSAYVSDEAQAIDEQIFFYVDDDEFCLTDGKLKHIIEEAL